jgi:hypothetical protein
MIATRASHTLAGLIPDARVVIYPDASHGAIFQYASETVATTLEFLDAWQHVGSHGRRGPCRHR